MSRKSWDEYFLSLAVQVASRSTCLSRQVGCVLVSQDHRILATGYNGAPKGIAHCTDKGVCIRRKLGIPSGEQLEMCYANHAEQNAIIQAATSGVSIKGSICYCTTMPCVHCARMLINCDVTKIFYIDGYPQSFALDLLSAVNIPIVHYPYTTATSNDTTDNCTTDPNTEHTNQNQQPC